MKKLEKTKRAVVMKAAETKKRKFLKKFLKKKFLKKFLKKKFLKKKKATLTKRKGMSEEKFGFFIPGDIVSEILLRLPARSVGKFRCVSKSWLSITSNTAFVRSNAQHNRITRQSLILGDNRRPTKFYLALPEANYESSIRLHLFQPMKTTPENSCLLASCDGLVCLGTFHGLKYYVVNPLTGQSITLPIDGVELSCNLGFYFHRSTAKYRLVRFTNTRHENEVLVVGESSWRRISSNLPAFFHCPHPLDLNGNIYWLAHSQNTHRSEVPPDTMVIFDEEEEVYSVISLPPLDKFHDLGGNMINLNGELGFWVVSKDNTIDVWILRNGWIKSYSFNYAHIHGRPSQLTIWWILGGAITFGDQDLLVIISEGEAPHSLVRCNLKSKTCVVQNSMAQCFLLYSTFPYTETLTNPQSSAST